MASYFDDREEIFANLSKDKSYPCQHCKRVTDPKERIECGDKGCDRWQAWFRHTWHNIRKSCDDIKCGG